MLSYDGWEMPVPLRIDVEHGDASVEVVAREILGLTKLNYNACKVGDASPVTVGFSNAVGEILVSNPTIKNPRPNFKFPSGLKGTLLPLIPRWPISRSRPIPACWK